MARTPRGKGAWLRNECRRGREP